MVPGMFRICVICWGSTAPRWSSPTSSHSSTAKCLSAVWGTAKTTRQSARSRCPASPPCSPRSSTSGPNEETTCRRTRTHAHTRILIDLSLQSRNEFYTAGERGADEQLQCLQKLAKFTEKYTRTQPSGRFVVLKLC